MVGNQYEWPARGLYVNVYPITRRVFLTQNLVVDDQRLAGTPLRPPASSWLIVRHTTFTSEKRCG